MIFKRQAAKQGPRRLRGTLAIAFAPCTVVLALCAFGAHAQTWDTLHASAYSVWVTPSYNLAACNVYKTNLDSVSSELDIAIPLIQQYLGVAPPEKPQRVQIDSNTSGMGGWSSGGDVGYRISDFFGRPTWSDGLRWIRGVIIGEVINSTTGAVSDNWPVDWWCDHVWYFPGFVAGEILKQAVDTAFGNYWLTSENYPTYPVYNTFKSLLTQFGWAYYKNFFAAVLADSMHWGNIGANPSQIKTDYVIAYMSLAAGRDLGGVFDSDQVANADSAEIAAIMEVEERLVIATKNNLKVATAWSDFRSGDYASAKTILNGLGVTQAVHPDLPRPAAAFSGAVTSVTVYSLSGRRLFCGAASGLAGISARMQQSAIAFYKYGNGAIAVKKILLTP